MSHNETEVSETVELLFRRAYQDDLPTALRNIADYFEFLAERIHPQRGVVSTDPALIGRFEAVYLWLSDRLLMYPDAVRNQVRELVSQKALCERFAVIASVVEEAVAGTEPARGKAVRVAKRGRVLVEALAAAARVGLPEESTFPTREQLSDIKITLRRLAQILRYASSLDAPDYEETFADVRENYDPNLIDKNRLGVLINILRIQVAEVPDEIRRQKLLHSIDRLEAETRRPKVRWGVVIAGFFVLFGFLADLKSLSPEHYEAPLRTVETIISVLHEDAQVQKSRGVLPRAPSDDSPVEQGGQHSTEYPMRALPPELTREDET